MNPSGKHALLVSAVLLLAAAGARGQSGGTPEEKTLFKRAEAFVAAFNKGDAKAVADFWTPEGDYIDQTGKHLKGRAAIEKAFVGLFAENKGLKLRIQIKSLTFVSPETAVEDGVTEVFSPSGGPPTQARYTIVHVKKNGQWHLHSVRDSVFVPATAYENLHVLEWLVGEWADQGDKSEVARVSFTWAANQNYLIGSFATTIKDIRVASATQWIAWDPATKQIRSWTFDGDGSFGESAWTGSGGKWTIKNKMTAHDGKQTSSTNVVTRVDADTLSLHIINRMLDGKALPDAKIITMKRVK